MNEIDFKEVGQSAKLTREQHGWSQKDVAEKIGVSRSLLAKFESVAQETYLKTP